MLVNIEASVIDNCIEVIIGLPDKRKQRLKHRTPSYFDTPDTSVLEAINSPGITERAIPRLVHMAHLDQPTSIITSSRSTTGADKAKCRGSRPCKTCSPYISMGYSCAIYSTYELLYVHLNQYSYCTDVRTSDVSCKLSIITYLTHAACTPIQATIILFGILYWLKAAKLFWFLARAHHEPL